MTAPGWATRSDLPPNSAQPTCTAIGGCLVRTDSDGRCVYCSAPVTRVARRRLAAEIARLQP